MIALLFLLLTLAMLAAWRDKWAVSYSLFAVTMGLSVYWLKFHATTPLAVQL
ncbi:DUF5993 family protein [Sneathiella chungangensis]|uniref:DUF5993 family protein n=1 Tax=Sneathiella chungangensis TaxID=1418234 RepID=UPI0013C2A392|nr:DUF5993 family protein [Sneathiella chungangensis]